MQPIWWTLFAVFFSYLVLAAWKHTTITWIVWFLDEPSVDSPIASPSSKWYGWFKVRKYSRMFISIIVPMSDSMSKVYFGLMIRITFIYVYVSRIIMAAPETHRLIMSLVVTILLVFASIRSLAMLCQGSYLLTALRSSYMSSFEYLRKRVARTVIPNVHFIATVAVLLFATLICVSLCFWIAQGISEEVIFLYGRLSHYSRSAHAYVRDYSSETDVFVRSFSGIRDWLDSVCLSDAVSTKTKEVYAYLKFIVDERNRHSSVQSLGSLIGTARDHLEICTRIETSPVCDLHTKEWSRHFDLFEKLGNVTEILFRTIRGEMDKITDQPSIIVYGLGEMLDYFSDEPSKVGGSLRGGYSDLLRLTQQNGELSKTLWLLKDIVFQGGALSLGALLSLSSLIQSLLSVLFDSFLQAAVFITTLFILLQSKVGVYNYTAVMFHFLDPSNKLYSAVHGALRAILYSAAKMAVFHGLYTWFMFSLFAFRVTCIPTVTAFILGLLPVISPVFVVGIVIPPWLYYSDEPFMAGVVTVINLLVWWFVGPAIYAEIPDSSPWMTTFAVGFGISLFGVRGVIMGPAIAVIPFALYRLAVTNLQTNISTDIKLSGISYDANTVDSPGLAALAGWNVDQHVASEQFMDDLLQRNECDEFIEEEPSN